MSTPGPHDVGGRRGYGPVRLAPGEPVYGAEWEGRVIGATLCTIAQGLYPVDRWRARQEELHPLAYVRTPYFERWLYTLERNLVIHGVLTEEEIDARLQEVAADPGLPLPERDDPALAAAIDGLIEHGAPVTQDVPTPPRFAPGDLVRLREIPLERPGEQHTRLPAYAQGHVGVVARRHPGQALPDLVVEDLERRPEHTYAVRLAASDLWPDGDPAATVCVDVWESYMEAPE